MPQRFLVEDKAKVLCDPDPSWIGKIVTIKSVMPDSLPFDYYVKRTFSDGSIAEAWYDDFQLSPIEPAAPTPVEAALEEIWKLVRPDEGDYDYPAQVVRYVDVMKIKLNRLETEQMIQARTVDFFVHSANPFGGNYSDFAARVQDIPVEADLDDPSFLKGIDVTIGEG